jgi:hypothetical protein
MFRRFRCSGRTAVILLVAFAAAARVSADGGVVQFRKQAGPFAITLFSSTSPLRAGPVDLSVLVESSRNSTPILDASVSLQLQDGKGEQISVAATHAQATNKLLYAALPDIPDAGTWDVEITVAHDADRSTVAGNIRVIAARSAVMEYWPYFAVVPVFIGLFMLNQHLKAKQRGQASRPLTYRRR